MNITRQNWQKEFNVKLLVQIVNWTMFVIGALATISLISQSDNGVAGNGMSILVGIVWVIQSITTLFYIHESEK